MTLNITCDLLETEIIGIVHKVIVIPQLISLYLISIFLFLVTGLVLIDGSRGEKPYQKFIFIWIAVTILIGLVVIFMIYSPNSVNAIVSKFLVFWS